MLMFFRKPAVFLMAVFLFSCAAPDRPKGITMEIQTVKKVDLKRYCGKWFEIARFQHSFEKDLVCVTAEYIPNNDGRITVLNSGRKENNRNVLKKAKGVAWIPDESEQGRLKVRFFWPFSGDYWILALDENSYEYVLVGDQSREYLWILSRKTTLDEKIFTELVQKAKSFGFDTDRLIRVPQDCN